MWRRWDPHIHAPGTLFEDSFGGDWEAYFKAIEESTPRIRALGVTDYFCIQTYKEVRKRKAAEGRLKEVEFLFPNVEMRLEIKTAKQQGINLHLLFSPDDPQHETTIERILGRLHFRFGEQDYACNKQELIDLGRAFDPKQTDERGAHKTGANLFKVSFPELQKLFRNEHKWLSNNCLVAVAGSKNDGTAGTQDDSSFAGLRQEVERFADIIFASTPSQREFWLGKTPKADRKTIEEKYRFLKPCMHGCDAHWVAKVGDPDADRMCWVKGDLSFEALRQVVLEPEDRVRIGPAPPVGPSPSETMKSVTLKDAPFVATPTLPINSGLIAIIGARGSGKTAMMEFLAAGASALTSKAMASSFIQRAGPLLGEAEVEITWADTEKHSAQLHDPYGWRTDDVAEVKVRYLSQQFVENLCSASGLATELRQEMERVVFEATEQGNRMQCDNFAELSAISLAPVQMSRFELEESIVGIGGEILKEDQLREQIPAQAEAIKNQKLHIEKLQKEMKDILPKDKQAHAAKLVELEAEYKRAESKVEGLRLRNKHLGDLLLDVGQTTQTREPNRLRDQKNRFLGAKLSDADWEAFRMEFVGDPAQIIRDAMKSLNAAIKLAVDGDPANSLDPTKVPASILPLTQLGAVRDASKSAVGIDTQKQKKYEELQRTIGQLETALVKMEADHLHAKGAGDRRQEHVQRRRDEYVEVFKTFVEEERILASLYEPLSESLAAAKGALTKLAFVVEREVKIKDWVKAGEDLIDLRLDSEFRLKGSLLKIAEKYLLGPWSTGGPDQVAEAIDKFRTDFQEDFKKAIPAFDTPEKLRIRRQEIGAWLYSTSHIKVQYGITYEGTPIERLSPGTRGIVLLLLYLAVDIHDLRPLFIDQPEENLDPRSVFKELVPHFRSAKHRRQVVIVTHNPNLVVNTDADQIIIATSERKDDSELPSISYESGSIENPKIRKAVCKLLEGGRRAFLDRERRYRIHSGDAELADEEA